MAGIKKLVLNDIHESLGAKMMEFAGYNMPVRYSSDMEEHHQVRKAVGIFDVSHMGEFFVSGEYALPLLQKLTTNDVSKLNIGQAQYSSLTNEKGGIVDDLIIYKLGDEEYMLVVNASNIEKDWQWIEIHNDAGVKLENKSDEYCLFAIQGPKSSELLNSLTSIDLNHIKYYTFTTGDIAGASEVIISATGYTGSGGFELYVKNEDAISVWNSIMKVGEKFNIKPIGLGARDTLRLEMGYCLYGNDITDNTTPIEAGLSWITKFSKSFNGDSILLKQKEEGVDRKLVGFKMIDKGIPRSHYNILNEGNEVIGEVTSGTMSPTIGIGIGMGYLQKIYCKVGTEIFIEVRNRVLKAQVVTLPFIES